MLARKKPLRVVAGSTLVAAATAACRAGFLATDPYSMPGFTGSVVVTETSPAGHLNIEFDYAVFAPGTYPGPAGGGNLTGSDPSAGQDYVYAYAATDLASSNEPVTTFDIGWDPSVVVQNVGLNGSLGGVAPSYSGLIGGNAFFCGFFTTNVAPGSSTEIVTFTSPKAPIFGDNAAAGNGGVNLQAPVPSPSPPLYFTGSAGSGIWDVNNTTNFTTGSGALVFRNQEDLTFDDSTASGGHNFGQFTVNIANGGVVPGSTNVSGTTNYTFTGGGIGGVGALNKLGSCSLTLENTGNTYQGGTNVIAGTLILASGTALPSGSTLTVASGASVQFANHGASSAFVPVVSSLSDSGAIDLVNNAMVLQNSTGSLSTITSEVAAAYNGGAWNGTGNVITSSAAAADTTRLTAIGIATGLTTVEGLTVGSSDVLLKYSYYGDANLDGQVDGSDYSRIDNGFLQHLTGWFNGDFNYDGVVDGSDYTLIDNAFNTQGASLTASIANPSAAVTAQIAATSNTVPEPMSIGLLGVSLIGLLGRRRGSDGWIGGARQD